MQDQASVPDSQASQIPWIPVKTAQVATPSQACLTAGLFFWLANKASPSSVYQSRELLDQLRFNLRDSQPLKAFVPPGARECLECRWHWGHGRGWHRGFWCQPLPLLLLASSLSSHKCLITSWNRFSPAFGEAVATGRGSVN